MDLSMLTQLTVSNELSLTWITFDFFLMKTYILFFQEYISFKHCLSIVYVSLK